MPPVPSVRQLVGWCSSIRPSLPLRLFKVKYLRFSDKVDSTTNHKEVFQQPRLGVTNTLTIALYNHTGLPSIPAPSL